MLTDSQRLQARSIVSDVLGRELIAMSIAEGLKTGTDPAQVFSLITNSLTCLLELDRIILKKEE
jgi:hypothetical protein